MGGTDEAQARTMLAAMQERLLRSPYDALGVISTATQSDVRTAFLALTKVFHPARYGRMAPEVQRLANEVFLGLRAAHEALSKPSTRSRHSQLMPIATQRHPTPIPTSRPPSGENPTARGTQPLESGGREGRAPTPIPVAQSGATPQPMTRPADASQRPSKLPMAQSGTTPQPMTRPAADASQRPSKVSTGSPPSRPGNERLIPSTTPAPEARVQAPAQARVLTQRGAVPPKPPVTAEAIDLAGPLDLLARGQWDAARAALNTLATKHPGVPRYRALLAYGRGREAQVARRIDEARVELEQALQIDPELQVAKSALGELFTRRK